MNNINREEPFYQLSFQLEASVKEGLKPVLMMAVELKSEMGLITDDFIVLSPGVGNGEIQLYKFSYEDAKAVIDGCISEEEYLERNK